MKLLLCLKCTDILRLRFTRKLCECGKSSGLYTDEINASFTGPCVLLGLKNSEVIEAVRLHRKNAKQPNGYAHDFTWWIIPEDAPSITREGEPLS